MAAILFKRFHRLNAAKENQNILEKDAPAPVLNDYICQKSRFYCIPTRAWARTKIGFIVSKEVTIKDI